MGLNWVSGPWQSPQEIIHMSVVGISQCFITEQVYRDNMCNVFAKLILFFILLQSIGLIGTG